MIRPTAAHTASRPIQGAARRRSATAAGALLLGSLLIAALPASAAQVYQWKDANGVTHYSDSPPPGQEYQNRNIESAAPASGDTATETAQTEAPAENAACRDARANLKTLADNQEVGIDSDGDGTVDSTLDADQRASQQKLAEAAIEVHCK
ncbi:DUF4124 domain-containing protein [Lysobacter maris]|uniref:DUF4124 domain-containing protein n=1 Tax=Marilutibacter maris TaxID=1605891 RepID=A0A508AZP6_9GAMM|nr:DUF4124 domain-containing protein [Lysobacter maris]KAB8185233.1 DUF4124 domain-containing protein [Lysobacter maris]